MVQYAPLIFSSHQSDKIVGEIFTVTSSDVHISGLLIKNPGISYLEENAGIRLKEVRNCSITNNTFGPIVPNYMIYIDGVTANYVKGLLVSGNNFPGIAWRHFVSRRRYQRQRLQQCIRGAPLGHGIWSGYDIQVCDSE